MATTAPLLHETKHTSSRAATRRRQVAAAAAAEQMAPQPPPAPPSAPVIPDQTAIRAQANRRTLEPIIKALYALPAMQNTYAKAKVIGKIKAYTLRSRQLCCDVLQMAHDLRANRVDMLLREYRLNPNPSLQDLQALRLRFRNKGLAYQLSGLSDEVIGKMNKPELRFTYECGMIMDAVEREIYAQLIELSEKWKLPKIASFWRVYEVCKESNDKKIYDTAWGRVSQSMIQQHQVPAPALLIAYVLSYSLMAYGQTVPDELLANMPDGLNGPQLVAFASRVIC